MALISMPSFCPRFGMSCANLLLREMIAMDCKRCSKNQIWGMIAFSSGSLFWPSFGRAASLQSYENRTHLEFERKSEKEPQLLPIMDGKKLKGLKIYGDTLPSQQDLASASDERTQSLTLKKDEKGNLYLEVQFTAAATNRGVEYFGYEDKKTAKLLVDYWTQDKKKASKPLKKKLAASKQFVSKPRIDIHSSSSCNQQKLDLIQEGGIDFKVYHEFFDYLSYNNGLKLEERFFQAFYESSNFAKVPSQEKVHFSLVKKLYQDSKLGLVLKTADLFEKEFPKSIFKQDMLLIKALVFLKLSKLMNSNHFEELALSSLRGLVDSDHSHRGRLSLNYLFDRALQEQNWVQALELASLGSSVKYEGLTETDHAVFRLATGEILQMLNDHEKAQKIYSDLMSHKSWVALEASIRQPEIYFIQGYYERALFGFEQALKRAQQRSDMLKTALFNLAESYFRIQKYQGAQKYFESFLTSFPHAERSWAAAYRIAEIKHALNGKNEDFGKLAQNYNQIIQRYPLTPGATFSYYRLASCLTKNDAEKKLVNFLKEHFEENQPSNLKYRDIFDASALAIWKNLTSVHFYFNQGEYDKVLALSKKYPVSDNKFNAIFQKALVAQARKIAGNPMKMDEKSAEQLLHLHEEHKKWINHSQSPAYSLSLANAYLKLKKVVELDQSLQQLATQLGSMNTIERNQYYWIAAKNEEWISPQSVKIDERLLKMNDDEAFAFYKYDWLAERAFQKQEYQKSLQYDSKNENAGFFGEKAEALKMNVSVRHAEALLKIREFKAALQKAQSLYLHYGTKTENFPLIARILQLQVYAEIEMENWKEARRLLEEQVLILPFPEKKLMEFRFLKAKALSKLGENKKAFEAFREIASIDTENAWKKSAQAELEHLGWEQSFQQQKQ